MTTRWVFIAKDTIFSLMKHLLFSILFLSFTIQAFAQLQDDFSDGDFTNNPTWTGDVDNFVIDNQRLRSAGPNLTAELALSTSNTRIASTEWRFLLDLRFAPSANNQPRIYLVSDQNNLKGSLNGYYIEIGQTGDDFIRFFRQVGTTRTLLFTGTTAFSGNVITRIKVLRDALGNWQIFADASGGMVFLSEGSSFFDNTHLNTAFFGVVCRHTSGNRDNFFFDDFYVGDEIIDTEAPQLLSILVENSQRLLLQFNEALATTPAQNIANYTVNNQIGTPTQATLNPSNPSQVFLEFNTPFPSGIENTLTFSNLTDLANNPINPNPSTFTFIFTAPPSYHDIIITEIMADPTGNSAPLNGLPNAEFVELYNRSNRPIDLKDVVFLDNGGRFPLPTRILMPNEYITLCGQNDAAALQNFGQVITIPSFPSLTNGGELLMLENINGELLFAVEYADTWYKNSSKADGGWTLEMIDTNRPCEGRFNWRASEAPQGGTPSRENSIRAVLPDLTAPELWRAEAIDAQTIRLSFNQSMAQASLRNGTYQLSNGLTVEEVILVAPFFRQVLLKVSPSLEPNQSYSVVVTGVTDCSANLIREINQANFGLPTTSEPSDVILNELLFNPRTGGREFLELYNRSDKFINLKDWKLANLANDIIANQRIITADDYIMPPKTYTVLSLNTDNILDFYPLAKPRTFLQMSSVPSYPNARGTVFVINAENQVMERFDYDERFHFPLLDNRRGVSLERISFEVPTNQADSWQSASANVGFATPGYLNSQTARPNTPSGKITLNPQVFTPDGDGREDFTQIQYVFERGGYVIDITIYDRTGREIKRIAERKLLGTEEGFFTWDGTDNNGGLARMGYYLVLVKALDLNGNTEIYKEKVVVGKRF